MATPKSSRKKKIIVLSLLGLLVVVIVAVVVFGGNKENIITVQTAKVVRTTITQVVDATGKIHPQTQVKINAEVSGELIDLPVKEGDRVKRGQLLARIKPEAYVADKQQSVANLNRAKAYLVQREADFRKIESEYKRQQELFRKGLISESDIETAKSAFEIAKANVDAAKYDVANSQAVLDRAQESLSKTSIYSPIDGVVSQLVSKLGERVSGSSFTQGTEIMTVSNLGVMEARVEVNENDVVTISIGDTARVEVDAYPDREFLATVYQIANTATTTGLGTQEEVTNFEVRLLLLDKGVEFRPGMSCSASIETDTRPNVLAVPLASVTTREKKAEEAPQGAPGEEDMSESAQPVVEKKQDRKKPQEVVFVVDGSKVAKRVVTTGISSDELIEVRDGLKEGDVVVKGSYRAVSRELDDGSTIRVEGKDRQGPSASK
jgi:HlyD family secretion protein